MPHFAQGTDEHSLYDHGGLRTTGSLQISSGSDASIQSHFNNLFNQSSQDSI